MSAARALDTACERARSAPRRPLQDKRVTVMGLGLFGGGVETIRYLAARGARVTVTDLRPDRELRESLELLEGLDVRRVLGRHRAGDFTDCDLVVANPAVPPTSPFLSLARAAGREITSETALFLEACPARVVLVTGTQGKSSTCTFLASLLEACGRRTHLGGNIGRSLLGCVDDMRADDAAVVEISSYQLEALSGGAEALRALGRRVECVCVLNVLADHLERHGSIRAYEAAKRRILELAGPDACVLLSGDDARLRAWSVPHGRLEFHARDLDRRGWALRDGSCWLNGERFGSLEALDLPLFQHANVLAALAMAHRLGAPASGLVEGLACLRAPEHRLEDLGPRGGHRVWDNGVSTTPDSTLSALSSVPAPLLLLCGGQAKSLDYDALARAARDRARAVVTFGADRDELAGRFARAGVAVGAHASLVDAVAAAFRAMQPGDGLLFSPACASFDAYRNFKERADAFRAALPDRDEP
jgi:UDP-N-acetylmuramoylalanine--D-glutamate ligase